MQETQVATNQQSPLSDISNTWLSAIGRLELLSTISNEEKTEEEWLACCAECMKILNEIIEMANEQRSAILQSIRYEFPVNNVFIDENELMDMSESDLMLEDVHIFENYGVDDRYLFSHY